MLEQAGGADLGAQIDSVLVDRVLDDVEVHAAAVRGQRSGG